MLLFLDFISYYSEGISSNGINWGDKIVTAFFTLLGTGTGAYLGYRFARMLDNHKNRRESNSRYIYLINQKDNIIPRLRTFKGEVDTYIIQIRENNAITAIPFPVFINVLERISKKIEIDKHYTSYLEIRPGREDIFNGFIKSIDYLYSVFHNNKEIATKALEFQYKRGLEYKEISDNLIELIQKHIEGKNPIFPMDMAFVSDDPMNAQRLIAEMNNIVTNIRRDFFAEFRKPENANVKFTIKFTHEKLINVLFEEISQRGILGFLNSPFYVELNKLNRIYANQTREVEAFAQDMSLDIEQVLIDLEKFN